MILPDVNVLIPAFRSDTSDHDLCRSYMQHLVNGEASFGVSTQVLSSLVRITTHPRIFKVPSLLAEALEFSERLLSVPHCVTVRPADRHWAIFTRLCRQADARGNLIPDAWFAALAIESGSEWITLDHDYARFKGLNWSSPREMRA